MGTLHASAHTDSLDAVAAITAFQQDLNDGYLDPEKSPLNPWELEKCAEGRVELSTNNHS